MKAKLIISLVVIAMVATAILSAAENSHFPSPTEQAGTCRKGALEQKGNCIQNPAKWIPYCNKKIGISFHYPCTWRHDGEDVQVLNLSGAVVAVEINFVDTISQSTLLIGYHFEPNGRELYQYALSHCDSSQGRSANNCRHIMVGGNRAVESVTLIGTDGKGNALLQRLMLIVVDVLDNQQQGGIEFQFRTTLPDSVEIDNFHALLSTFRFDR